MKSICNNCVLPETSNNTFDEKGICQYCNTPSLLKHISKEPDEQTLLSEIELIKKKNRDNRYDCIVGWSGGRDSTYLIDQLVNKHKLRCVAVFGKTPFTPNEIINNVRTIAQKLNIKLIEIDTHEKHQSIAEYFTKEWIKNKQPILINFACAPCKFVNKEIFKIAHQLKINTVIYGGNRFEYFPNGPASIDIDSKNRYNFFNMFLDLLKRVNIGLKVIFKSPSIFKHIFILGKASLLYLNQYTVYLRLRYPNINRFDYFHFIDWDESTINNRISKMGWTIPNNCATTWRADCEFEAIKNYVFNKQIGYTYPHALYSNLIRTDKMDREDAIVRIEKEGISNNKIENVLNKLNIQLDLFTKIGD